MLQVRDLGVVVRPRTLACEPRKRLSVASPSAPLCALAMEACAALLPAMSTETFGTNGDLQQVTGVVGVRVHHRLPRVRRLSATMSTSV